MSEDLTPFDRITACLPQLSPFQAMWNEAEEVLAASCLGGFEVEEIGRIAFDCLPDEEKPAALDALFYCWWEAEQDRKARAAKDPCRPCGCPKRFDRHAWGCPKEAAS